MFIVVNVVNNVCSFILNSVVVNLLNIIREFILKMRFQVILKAAEVPAPALLCSGMKVEHFPHQETDTGKAIIRNLEEQGESYPAPMR